MLATVDTPQISEAVARNLPDLRDVSTAQSLEEARDLVSRKIYPHRLQIVGGDTPHLMCVTSALSLGDCALDYVQYGHDVIIHSGVISEYQMVKSTLVGHGRITCGDQTVASHPDTIIMTSMTSRTDILMTSQCRHL